ncbi:hypothetical protein AO379_1671 [Moraxella catarrhalis]|nr:hypothetical protein AO379_1671 [Moraxella catarrhalis]
MPRHIRGLGSLRHKLHPFVIVTIFRRRAWIDSYQAIGCHTQMNLQQSGLEKSKTAERNFLRLADW